MRHYERMSIGNRAAFEAGGGQLGPKFQVEGDVIHQPFFVSENNMNRPFMWYKNVGRTFVRFVTIHACDGRTDERTDGFAIGKTALHIMERGNKTKDRWNCGVDDHRSQVQNLCSKCPPFARTHALKPLRQ